jgi:ELWxxDGT repeat protein
MFARVRTDRKIHSRHSRRFAEPLERRTLLSVSSIYNLGFRTGDSSSYSYTAFYGQVVFSESGPNGIEPYITDGTPLGTRLLADINPGPGSSNPSDFFYLRKTNQLFFFASTPDVKNGLYVSDPSGTRFVKDVTSNMPGGSGFLAFDDEAYFFAGGNLWRSDGTASGTQVVWANPDGYPPAPVVFGNELIFSGYDAASGWEPRALSDDGSIRLIDDIIPGSAPSLPGNFIVAGSRLFFSAYTPGRGGPAGLYVTDGSASGTHLVVSSAYGTTPYWPRLWAADGDRVFLLGQPQASPTGGPTSLWISDGTPAGTIELNSSPFFRYLQFSDIYAVVNGELIFQGPRSTNTGELWGSDGTVGGTGHLLDFYSGSGDFSPYHFVTLGDRAYFTVGNLANLQWWSTDGTASGTTRWTHPYAPTAPQTLGGRYINPGPDFLTGIEPYAYDPDTGAATLLADFNVTPVNVDVSGFIRGGNNVYFGAGGSILATDGSTPGTLDLVDNAALMVDGAQGANGQFYFLTSNALYSTDGTPSGTQKLAMIPYEAMNLALVNNRVVVLMRAGFNGFTGDYQLYSYDMTGGTQTLLNDLGSCTTAQLAGVTNGHAIFSSVADGVGDLLQTDGTLQGTTGIASAPREYGGVYIPMGAAAGVVYLAYEDPQHQKHLYRTDGTDAGTSSLAEMGDYSPGVAWGGDYYFFMNSGVYRTDGSTLTRVADVDISGPTSRYESNVFRAAVLGGYLYFIDTDGVAAPNGGDPTNSALWRTDGTAAGTTMVKALPVPLIGIDSPRHMLATDDRIYFDAGGSSGALYSSDGTEAGTVLEPNAGSIQFTHATEAAVPLSAALDHVVICSNNSNPRQLLRVSSSPGGTIEGSVFLDLNKDGHQQTGEPPVEQRIVYLDLNDNGILDANEGYQRTDPTGQFAFAGLAAWTYHLREVLPPDRGPGTAPADLTLADNQSIEGVSLGEAIVDTTPPVLLSKNAYGGGAGAVDVEFRFSEAVLVPSIRDIVLTNQLTGEQVAFNSNLITADQWNRVLVNFYAGALPSGMYELTLPAGGATDLAGNPLASPAAARFLVVDAGETLALPPGNTTVVNGVAFASDAHLDLGTGSLAIDYSGISTLGTWHDSRYIELLGLIQTGVIGSAASGQNTTIGAAEASDVLGISGTQTAIWDGQTVDSSTILIKCTYRGDANLDGKVNIDDYGRIDANVGQSGTVFGWYNGDFNFDGKINIDDYGLIDSVIGSQGPVL